MTEARKVKGKYVDAAKARMLAMLGAEARLAALQAAVAHHIAEPSGYLGCEVSELQDALDASRKL